VITSLKTSLIPRTLKRSSIAKAIRWPADLSVFFGSNVRTSYPINSEFQTPKPYAMRSMHWPAEGQHRRRQATTTKTTSRATMNAAGTFHFPRTAMLNAYPRRNPLPPQSRRQPLPQGGRRKRRPRQVPRPHLQLRRDSSRQAAALFQVSHFRTPHTNSRTNCRTVDSGRNSPDGTYGKRLE